MPEQVALQLRSCFSKVSLFNAPFQTWPIKSTSGPTSYIKKGNVSVLGEFQTGIRKVNSALHEAFCWSAAKLYCRDLRVRESRNKGLHFFVVVAVFAVHIQNKDDLLHACTTQKVSRQIVGCLCHQLPVYLLAFLFPCLGFSFPVFKMMRLNWMLFKLSFNSQTLC